MPERLLNFYKRWVSVAFPPACRYVPSCSEYAAEAVARHGVVIGTFLGAWRLLRCNPLSHGGHDPVPQNLHLARNQQQRGASQ